MNGSQLLFSYRVAKHALDWAGALLGLVLLSPLLLTVGLLVRLTSPGPALYRQERVGASGRVFRIYKFRSMESATPVLSTEDMQQQNRSFVTPLGHWLRQSNIDELPQLLNILKGEMSFVGPRPALPTQHDVLQARVQKQAAHLRPGITGLAQVRGRDDLDVKAKTDLDAQYSQGFGLIQDCNILFVETPKALLSNRGNK